MEMSANKRVIITTKDNSKSDNTVPKQHMTDEEIEKAMNEYVFIKDSVLISVDLIKAMYYVKKGIMIENVRVGVIILVKCKGKIYLCLVKERAIEKKWQKWGIPKGGVESGHSIVADDDSGYLNFTAQREIYEELNYNINPIELGKCPIVMIDVPQRRDSTVSTSNIFNGGEFSQDPKFIKHTLNAYYLYTFDGDKHGFDVEDPYRGRDKPATNSRLKIKWLLLTANSELLQFYKEMNKSTQTAVEKIVDSLDNFTFQ
jgi:8-oxo-dGTP pyrophosphatase MutT (NUDIX family)